MRQIKFISSLLFLFFFISCTESSNPIESPAEQRVDRKGLNQVTGGGPTLTISTLTNSTTVAVVDSHTVTLSDIMTIGGGVDPMTWHVYSTHDFGRVGGGTWEYRIYLDSTLYAWRIANYSGTISDGNDVSLYFTATIGDDIYIEITGSNPNMGENLFGYLYLD